MVRSWCGAVYLSFERCFSLDIFWTMTSLRVFRLRTMSNLRKKPSGIHFDDVHRNSVALSNDIVRVGLVLPFGPLHILHQILKFTETHFGKQKFGHFNIPVFVLGGAPTVQCCRVYE